jgi:hypothetical protein
MEYVLTFGADSPFAEEVIGCVMCEKKNINRYEKCMALNERCEKTRRVV